MSKTQAPDPARGRFWVEYDNDTGPGDEGLIEWWSVVDEQSGDTLCKCSSQTDADRIAALLNGSAIQAPEGAQAALNRIMRQAPCGHETLDISLGDGKTWAKCEDCGARIEQAHVPRARESAAQFADDINTIRAALAAPAPQAATVALADEQLHCGPCESRCSDCPIDWARFDPPAPQTKEPTNDR